MRPCTDSRPLGLALAGAAGASCGCAAAGLRTGARPPGRQPLLDRVETAADGAQLGLQLADVVVRSEPATLERLGHRAAATAEPVLGAAAEVVDRAGQVV